MNEIFKLWGTIAIDGVSDAEKDINKLTNTAKNSENKLISGFKKIGIAVASAFAVDKIISFGQEIVSTAATVAAEQSAFAQIMGDYAEEASEKVSKIAEATGKVDTALTPYMTSMTAKFKGLGFGIEDATDYAVRGLYLASDAAAFWDMSLDESTSHLNSFINGSYEGGEAIGLFANDTQMAMYAVEQGIISSKKEWANLDEATKQATRLQYAENMMELSGATGQASKEASQYANVQANLNEKWRQFKAMIGQPILQNVVTPAMTKLIDVIDWMSESYQKASKWVGENGDKIETWTGIIISATAGVGTFLTIMNWGQIMAAASAALDLVTGAVKRLTMAITKNPIGAIISLIVALITYLVYLYNTNEEFRAFVDETLSVLWEKIKEVIAWIQENVVPVIEEIVAWIQENVLPVLMAVMAWIQENIMPVVSALLGWLLDAIGGFWEWLTGIFEGGSGTLGTIWDTICGFFVSAWEFIVSIWEACQPFFQGIWDGIIMPVWGLIQEIMGAFQMAWDVIKLVWGYVEPYFSAIWEGIKAAVSILWTFISTGFKNAWEMIKLVWSVVSSWFSVVWEAIKGVFSVVATYLGGFFRTAWEVIKAIWNVAISFFTMIWAGIKAVFAVVKGVLSGNFSDAWEAIKNVWDKVKAFFQSIWDGIKGVFGSIKTWFGDTFGAAWEAVKNVFSAWGSFFSGLWDKITNTFSKIGTNISEAIGGAVKSGLNGIISMIEGTINTGINMINGAINLINKIPGVSIGKFSHVSLPRLAEGGVVDRPTIAQIGENGAEAVVPLERNTGWIDRVAEKLSGSSNTSTSDESILDKLDELIEVIKQLKLYLDGDTLVGGLIARIDEKLGDINDMRVRAN